MDAFYENHREINVGLLEFDRSTMMKSLPRSAWQPSIAANRTKNLSPIVDIWIKSQLFNYENLNDVKRGFSRFGWNVAR